MSSSTPAMDVLRSVTEIISGRRIRKLRDFGSWRQIMQGQLLNSYIPNLYGNIVSNVGE